MASTSYGEEEMPVFFSQKLDEGYLSAYGGTFFNGGFPRQALDQLGVIFVGIDDNGNTIETPEVKVALVQ